MSDSEDDFMSDKFIVDTPAPSTSLSYSERRSKESLRSQRLGQSKNQIKQRDIEEARRREGLEKALWEREDEGQKENKGMEMMKKMGWQVGEGLGKKRSPSPEVNLPHVHGKVGIGSKRARVGIIEEGEEDDAPRAGLGSRKVVSEAQPAARVEPIRVSMWARRKGLSARSPTPPPLINPSNKNPDVLDPEKLERLGRATAGFRERQGAEWTEKERERKGRAAREKLVEWDKEKDVLFHPLHVLPFDPLGTLPRPLLELIYPSQISSSPGSSRSPSPEPILAHPKMDNLSAAEKLREQMRRDMLSLLGGDGDDGDEGNIKFGISEESRHKGLPADPKEGDDLKKPENEYQGVNWEEHVPNVKRVLSMDPAIYLEFAVDQLRHEHLFCLWCAYKYGSWEEMDGEGGCPGLDEDDH